MRNVLAVMALTLPLTVSAQDIEKQEEQLVLLRAVFVEAASVIRVTVPIVNIAGQPLVNGDWISIMTRPMPKLKISTPDVRIADFPDHWVTVRPWYLDVENEQAFRVAAYHELCHIKLGHIGTPFSFEKESEAARCGYDYVEPDDFYAVLRRMAGRREGWRFAELYRLPEDEFRRRANEAHGIVPRE